MSNTELCHQLRLLLQRNADAPPLSELLSTTESFLSDVASSSEPDNLLFQLEDELLEIWKGIVVHGGSTYQTEMFVSLLHSLRPVLTSTSLIATWWDLLLRPALREPKLSANAASLTRDLVLEALKKTEANDKLPEFRRRLLDLYLLDTYNETDAFEWAERDQDSRERQTLWKTNLEEILFLYGSAHPEDLSAQILECFARPSARVQLITLLSAWSAQPSFPKNAAKTLSGHSLLNSLLLSLQLDNSSTLCVIGLSLLVKLLPIFAVEASEELRNRLSDVLAILARMLCWKSRDSSEQRSSLLLNDDDPQAGDRRTLLLVRPDLGWERLELTFSPSLTSAPSPRLLFTCLYYLFPCNTLGFLRQPVRYLKDKQRMSPYTVDWEDAFDESLIRSKCEPILRTHITHPSIIWRDAATELAHPDRWAAYDVARIVGEYTALDMQNTSSAMNAATSADNGLLDTFPSGRHFSRPMLHRDDSTPRMVAHTLPTAVATSPLSTELHRISLQDMISTSIALRSNQPIEVLDATLSWPSILSMRSAGSPAKRTTPLPNEDSDAEPSEAEDGNQIMVEPPSPVSRSGDEEALNAREAVSYLQREILLLRNELNLELWLKRENIKHVGRLYQDRILEKNAEIERQGLHNKLREYKRQVANLQDELQGYKTEARISKTKTMDWNHSLQNKVKELREQKRELEAKAATLRGSERKLKAEFAAEAKLLADAEKRIIELETTIKETRNKIDRLKDYETRVEQFTAMQRLWDNDIQRYEDQKEEIKIMISKFKKMELLLQSYEKTQETMQNQAAENRTRIRELEAEFKLRQLRPTRDNPFLASIEVVSKRIATSRSANERLKIANAALRDEVEKLQAKLETQQGSGMRLGGPAGRPQRSSGGDVEETNQSEAVNSDNGAPGPSQATEE